eukprot:COSAG01_NODE_11469_length_1928_cov_1.777474_3_plen_151_part_00
MRCPSEQLCAVSAADRGADVQFAPEGFAPRWSLPSPFHGEEAKLPKGCCGAFRTAGRSNDQLTHSQHSTADRQLCCAVAVPRYRCTAVPLYRCLPAPAAGVAAGEGEGLPCQAGSCSSPVPADHGVAASEPPTIPHPFSAAPQNVLSGDP